MASVGKHRRMYTPAEVAVHNSRGVMFTQTPTWLLCVLLCAIRLQLLWPLHLVVYFPVTQDCWVSLFHRVLDLTPLLSQDHGKDGACTPHRSCACVLVLTLGTTAGFMAPGTLADPILKYAGQDVSHWFDSLTREVRDCGTRWLHAYITTCFLALTSCSHTCL